MNFPSITEIPPSQRPIIIGLHGGLQSGKDTLAAAMRAELGPRLISIAFATPLKHAMLQLFGGRTENYFGTNQDKDQPFDFWASHLGEGWQTYRQAMQSFGDVIRDHIEPNHLIHRAEQLILDHHATADLNEPPVYCITDVRAGLPPRIAREADAIRHWGGRVYRVLRADGVKAATTGIPGHRTEAEIPAESIDDVLTIEKGGHAEVARRILGVALMTR